MQTIFLILFLVIIYYGKRMLPESFNEWWENSTLNKWIYPIITTGVTIAVAIGIEYDVLNWGALLIPILLGVPYIWGMILGVWYNMKEAGSRVTYKEEAAKEIVIKSLHELGCQPATNKDGSIAVSYQGEYFNLECNPRYVRIWDTYWSSIKADDPDLTLIREAVNEANYSFGPTVLMSESDDDNDINFHSRIDIMLHPACPDNTTYIRAILDSFFYTKENVSKSFHKLRQKGQDCPQNRRPVGFATS